MLTQVSASEWRAHKAVMAEKGVILLPETIGYATDGLRKNYMLAADALPTLSTTANAGFPALFTSYVSPEAIHIVFSPLEAANIIGEQKMGDWLTDTAFFPVVEGTGEVSSYDDFGNNGRAGINSTFPQRQAYHFQILKEYGEREMERYGLAKLNYQAEVDNAAAENLMRFQNFTYFFGMQGLQNYGLLNDPYLPASLTPSTKAAGGVKWLSAGGVPNATANEVYADIQAMFYQLVNQTGGLVKATDNLVLAMSPTVSVALTITNSFGVDVYDLLKKNFPNIRFETAVQYGAITSGNPMGVAGGNFVQLIAEKLDGKDTAFCAFTEKMRAHKMEVFTSSFKQKLTSGTFGAIIRYPLAFASLIGV